MKNYIPLDVNLSIFDQVLPYQNCFLHSSSIFLQQKKERNEEASVFLLSFRYVCFSIAIYDENRFRFIHRHFSVTYFTISTFLVARIPTGLPHNIINYGSYIKR
jgi:hypothetical protein